MNSSVNNGNKCSSSEPSFADIIDFLPDPTFAIDTQGKVMAWNKAMIRLTGVSAEDMLGKCDYAYAVPFHGTRRPILIDLSLKWNEEIAKTYKAITERDGVLISEFENPRAPQETALFRIRACKMYNAEGSCIGAIEILRNISKRRLAEQRLSDREMELKSLNEHLERKVLERTAELKRRNKENKDLAQKTIKAMENDRKALSKELHDSIGGTLAAIKNQLEGRVEMMNKAPESVYMPLETIITYLAQAIKESRRITKQLRPLILDDFGLTAAVEEHIRDFASFHPNINVSQRISITEEALSNDAKTVLYRVLQEAMNNVGKHSGANFVSIRIRRYKSWVRLKVRDDGVGFNVDEVFAHGDFMTGYGLHSMRERAEICKGKFQIESTRGKGTTVIASVPLERKLTQVVTTDPLTISA